MLHCTGCGKQEAVCAGCLPPLDPPRYCRACGTWLAVRVRTGGWVARCRVHGEITSAGDLNP